MDVAIQRRVKISSPGTAALTRLVAGDSTIEEPALTNSAERLYLWYEDGSFNSRRRVRRGRAPRG